MTRQPRKLPNGDEWVGRRVSYKHKYAKPEDKPEYGTVVRMASGKELCMFVLFEGSHTAKLCYAKSLKKEI